MLNNGLYIYVKEEEKLKKCVRQTGAEYLLIMRNIQNNELDHVLFDHFINAHIRIDKLYFSNDKYQENTANLSAVHYSEYYESHVLHYYFDLDGNHLKSTCKLQGEDPSIIVLTDEQSKQFEENAQWAISYIKDLKDKRSKYVKRLLDDYQDIDTCLNRYFENDENKSEIKNKLGDYLRKLKKADLYMTGERSLRYKFLKKLHVKMCDFRERTTYNQSAMASHEDLNSFHADEQDDDTCGESNVEIDTPKQRSNDQLIINKCEDIIRRINSLNDDSHEQRPKENRHNLYQDLFLARFELDHIATQEVVELKEKIEEKLAHYKNPIDESLELIKKGDIDGLKDNIVFLNHVFPYRVCSMLDDMSQQNSNIIDENISKAIDFLLRSTKHHDAWKHYMRHIIIGGYSNGEMRFSTFKERLLVFNLYKVFLVFMKYYPSLGSVSGLGDTLGVIEILLCKIENNDMPFDYLVSYLEYKGVTSLEEFEASGKIHNLTAIDKKKLGSFYTNSAHRKHPRKFLKNASRKYQEHKMKLKQQSESNRSNLILNKHNMFSAMLKLQIVPNIDDFYRLYVRNTGLVKTIFHICHGAQENKCFMLFHRTLIDKMKRNLNLSDKIGELINDGLLYRQICNSYGDLSKSGLKLLQGMFNALERQFNGVNSEKILADMDNLSKKVKVIDKVTSAFKMRIIFAKMIFVTLNAKINSPRTDQEKLAYLEKVLLINHELYMEMKNAKGKPDFQLLHGEEAKERFELAIEMCKRDISVLLDNRNRLKERIKYWEDSIYSGKFGAFSIQARKHNAFNKVINKEFDFFEIKSFKRH